MEKGEKSGCAFEIHKATFVNFPEFARRFFCIGREVGVHFSFGTDAHRLEQLETKSFSDYLRKLTK
jgi:histidinol phosphatase-like PHP family hydrolase